MGVGHSSTRVIKGDCEAADWVHSGLIRSAAHIDPPNTSLSQQGWVEGLFTLVVVNPLAEAKVNSLGE